MAATDVKQISGRPLEAATERPPAPSAFRLLSKPSAEAPPFALTFVSESRESPDNENKLSARQRAERAAKTAADREEKLNSTLLAPAVAAAVLSRRHTQGYARAADLLKAQLPSTIDKQQALKESGLPQTAEGMLRALAPKDPRRPGLLITFSSADKEAVDQVVGELRDATTRSLLFSGGFGEMKTTRANSILVTKCPAVFDKTLEAANGVLTKARPAIVAQALLSIESQFGKEAKEAAEAALRTDTGRAKFDEYFKQAAPKAEQSAREATAQIARAAGAKLKEFACRTAAEYYERGVAEGLPVHLFGADFDFENKRAAGIEYYVETSEGTRYSLTNIGKNFENPQGSFVPAKPYAAFNVAVLRHYQEKGEVARSDLYRIAMDNYFYPSEDGKIRYVEGRRVYNRLKAVYDRKKSLSASDINAAAE